jgi:hypothetical protein
VTIPSRAVGRGPVGPEIQFLKEKSQRKFAKAVCRWLSITSSCDSLNVRVSISRLIKVNAELIVVKIGGEAEVRSTGF